MVDDLNLEIKVGEIVGLLGPNGAGKTTTIRMIAGVLPPSQGTVQIEGQNVLGYLPENNPLYENLTVHEYLNFWARLKNITRPNRDRYVKKAVESLGLEEVFYRPVAELSKGYRQRTGLAQALLADPPILLLDEPTEGLDPNQRAEIHKLVLGLGQERTVIICSHVLSEITKMCGRVIIINRGRVVADDGVENLINQGSRRKVITLVALGSRIKEIVGGLPGVLEVTREPDSDGKEKYTIVCEMQTDLRLTLFETAKLRRWDLYELHSQKQSLEDVFAQLTL